MEVSKREVFGLVLVFFLSLSDARYVKRPFARSDLCNSKIYCGGELLKTVQLARIFNDSKTFVDHYQLNDPDVTLSNFNKFMVETKRNPSREQVKQWVNENFATENELVNWTLLDWQQNPPLFEKITDPEFRKWAGELNDLWKSLAKKVSPEVQANPDRHSLIPLKNGFIIPGGRFKESYYWDSYWAIEGLLISGMHATARGMIENFLWMVERYGFIPNGGRVYYLMRSQPPLLLSMVQTYVEFTNDWKFAIDNLVTMEKEFAYFQREKGVRVKKDGQIYNMARYIVDSEGPRPESYREDYELAQKLPAGSSAQRLYEDLKAAAESGWDFSSRWFIAEDGGIGNLSQIHTRDIIPVDLNAILQKNAFLLGTLNQFIGKTADAKFYFDVAKEYQRGIDNVLWNEKEGTWFDYDLKNQRPRNYFYPSNLSPLYTRSFNFDKREMYAERTVDYLKRNRIVDYMGGTPTSLFHTREQWDFPNAWAPLQSFMVQALRNTGVEAANSLARELAIRWIRANFIGYTQEGYMYEKYDAEVPGKFGGGGEYEIQAGFAFTNGVALEFLMLYPDATPHDVLSSDAMIVFRD